MRFLFILFPIFLYSQEQTAKGVVLDKISNAPIPYVNISILESQVGTSSDEDGSYRLTIKSEELEKKVRLSSLGYKDTTIVVSNFLKLKKMVMRPISEQLEEVVISEKFQDKFKVINEINESNLCAGYGSTAQNPWILGVYFPYKVDYENTEFLNSIRFHFGNFKNKKAKFRLRLFTIGNDSLPHKDLIKENIIVSLKKKQKYVDINLSDYDIFFPSDVFYIAFEWLYIPYNAEEVTFHFGKNNKNKEKRIRHNPIISGICEEEGRFKVAAYMSGKWVFYAANKFQGKEKVIPAISLTLSN